MKKIFFGLTGLLLTGVILLTGCSGNGTPEYSLDEPFTLSINDSASIKGQDLEVTFVDVTDDSRCPEDVDCIWAGEAHIAIDLNETRVTLIQNGNSENQKSYSEGYAITFTLKPNPQSTTEISKADYELELTLSEDTREFPTDLTENKDLWQSKGITSYDFTLERSCFCPEDYRGPVAITVRNGAVESVVFTVNGEAVTDERFANVDTIEELFGILEAAYTDGGSFGEKAEKVEVTYDADYGYPTYLYIDQSSLIADEEQGYTITDFVAR